jgi:hypothetical protein
LIRRRRPPPIARVGVLALAAGTLAAAACTNDYGALRFPREAGDAGGEPEAGDGAGGATPADGSAAQD